MLSTDPRRVCLLFLISLVVCAVLNPGNFGVIDTTRRLQVARWMRLGELPVLPDDGDFGITGRNGVRQPGTGPGRVLSWSPSTPP